MKVQPGTWHYRGIIINGNNILQHDYKPSRNYWTVFQQCCDICRHNHYHYHFHDLFLYAAVLYPFWHFVLEHMAFSHGGLNPRHPTSRHTWVRKIKALNGVNHKQGNTTCQIPSLALNTAQHTDLPSHTHTHASKPHVDPTLHVFDISRGHSKRLAVLPLVSVFCFL